MYNTLTGELRCTQSASVVKIHPKWDGSFEQVFRQGGIRFCARCIPEPFVAAVVVLRSPLHAMFAEFNRVSTSDQHTADSGTNFYRYHRYLFFIYPRLFIPDFFNIPSDMHDFRSYHTCIQVSL